MGEAAAALSHIDSDDAFEVLFTALDDREPAADGGSRVLLHSLLSSPRAALNEATILPLVSSFAANNLEAAEFTARFDVGRAHLRALLVQRHVNQLALEALVSHRDAESVPLLLDRLQATDTGFETQIIITALGRIGDSSAVDGVAAKIESEGMAWVATTALSRMGEPGIAALVDRLQSPEPSIRAAASSALRAEREAALPCLHQAMYRGTVKRRASIVRALGSIGVSSTLRTDVVKLLGDPSPIIRLAAVESVAAIESGPTAKELELLLHDRVPEIRAAAARAVRVDDEDFVPMVAPLLRDGTSLVRLAAIDAIAKSVGLPVAWRFLGLLTDQDPAVRVAATRSLAVGGDVMLPKLGSLLLSEESRIREAAAEAISRIGGEGMDLLLAAIATGRPDVREAVAVGATHFRHGYFGIALTLLQDSDMRVRMAAASGLALRLKGISESEPDSLIQTDVLAALERRLPGDTDDESRAMLDALVASRSSQLGPAVAKRLATILKGEDIELARAAAEIIYVAFEDLDPVRHYFPGWFQVIPASDPTQLHVADGVLEIIGALRAAAIADRRTPSPAQYALASIRTAIDTLQRRQQEQEQQQQEQQEQEQEQQVQDEREELPIRKVSVLMDGLEPSAHPRRGHSRYLDATFLDRGNPVAAGSALHQGTSYILEVGIRVHPSGLPVVGYNRPFPTPDAAVDEAELTVVAEADENILQIDKNVATLVLPKKGDSKRNARFNVVPTAQTLHPSAPATIRLRVFYRFCLLESALIRAEVVSKYSPDLLSAFETDQPITLEHERLQRGYENLNQEIPRSLNIDVTPCELGYGLQFTWGDRDGASLSVAAELPLPQSALDVYLNDARKALVEVTMGGPYATNLEVSDTTYVEGIRRLALAGADLHTILFRGDLHSPLAKVGRLLTESPLPVGAVIQISLHKRAQDFVFPWALMYDGKVPEEGYLAPPIDGFWGARYCLEQTVPGSAGRAVSANHEIGASARMSFMLWQQFRNAESHASTLRTIAEESHGKLILGEPITRASDAIEALTTPAPSDIYYFYTHAHSREVGAGDGSLQSALDQLTRKSPEYKTLKAVYERTRVEREEESWIKLTHGQLKLRSLENTDLQFQNEPVVFVNACESGRLTPSLARESFVTFFLSRGAAAFVGTECTMTIVFAQAFGEFVLRELIAGSSIGAAVLSARRSFLAQKNPLGLAYSLYGDAGRSFGPSTVRTGNENEHA